MKGWFKGVAMEKLERCGRINVGAGYLADSGIYGKTKMLDKMVRQCSWLPAVIWNTNMLGGTIGYVFIGKISD